MFRKILDLLFNLCLISLIIWFLWEAKDWSFYSRLFPWSIGFPVLALTVFQLSSSLRNLCFARQEGSGKPPGDVRHSPPSQSAETFKSELNTARFLTIGCWIIIFFLGIWLLGFRLGSLVLTVSFLKFGAKESYGNCVWLAGVNYLFFLIIFDLALGVPLYQGAIAQWRGFDSVDGFILTELLRLWS